MAKKKPDRELESCLAAIPQGSEIESYELHSHTIELFVKWPEPGRDSRFCPGCGSTRCVKKDGGAMQTVRHVRSGNFGTLITFHKPRLRCKECGRSFYLKPPWVVGGMSVTIYLFFEIMAKLTSTTLCVEHIAKETNTSASIVLNVMNHLALDKPKSLPETIAIDEFHGSTGSFNRGRGRFDVEKYHCAITDPDAGCVLDILHKATFQELHAYFMDYPPFVRQRVRFFCTDMRGGFSKAARSCFPNARICIDPFHVVKLIIDAVDDVRRAAWHDCLDRAGKLEALSNAAGEAGDAALAAEKKAASQKAQDDAKLLHSAHRILAASPFNENAYWNRNEARRDARLKELYALAPDLATARAALEEFFGIVELDAYKLRRAGLSDWIAKYENCEIPSIRQAVFSIRKHRKNIENAWQFHKSNGAAEGLNKKIKDVRRMGFGAHSFENFRRRALLACGPTTIDVAGYTVFGEKNSQAPKEGLPRYE